MFLACVEWLAFRRGLPLWLPLVYVAMSVLTFFVYRADKRQAQSERWRVPEVRLHLLSLLGGWPGALVGMWAFRHKTRKASFLLVFSATVLAHVAIWAYLSFGKLW